MMLGTAMAFGALEACEKNTPSPAPISRPPEPQPNINDPNAVAAIYGAPPPPAADAAAQAQTPPPPPPEQPEAGTTNQADVGTASIYGGPPPGAQGLNGRPPRVPRVDISGMGQTRYGAPPAFDDIV